MSDGFTDHTMGEGASPRAEGKGGGVAKRKVSLRYLQKYFGAYFAQKEVTTGIPGADCCAGLRHSSTNTRTIRPVQDILQAVYETRCFLETKRKGAEDREFDDWYELYESCLPTYADVRAKFCLGGACLSLAKVCILKQKKLVSMYAIKDNFFYAAWGVEFALQALAAYVDALDTIERDEMEAAKLKEALLQEREEYEFDKSGKTTNVKHLYGRGAKQPDLAVFLKRNIINVVYTCFRNAGMANVLRFCRNDTVWTTVPPGNEDAANATLEDMFVQHIDANLDVATPARKASLTNEAFGCSRENIKTVLASPAGAKMLAPKDGDAKKGEDFWSTNRFEIVDGNTAVGLTDWTQIPPKFKGSRCAIC